MIFTPDDTKIHVAGSGYLIVYDSKTGEVLEKRREPFKDCPILPGCEIRSAFSPESKYFALERCGNLCLYDTQTWEEKWCVPTSTEGED